jgi:hypothetical protein
MATNETTKAERGDWDKDFPPADSTNSGKSNNSDREKIPFLDTSKPGKYKVRLVGPYVKCRKHFKPYRATVQDTDKENDPAWKAGWIPSKRYAINVLDRLDGNKLKILEKGPSVFKFFYSYKVDCNNDPSGKEGPDFMITVIIPKGEDGMPNKLKTEYTVTHLDKAPFTKEDMKMICETDKDGNIIKDEKTGKPKSKLFPLLDIYKSTTAEKMKQMWDAVPEDKRVPPKRESNDDESPKSKPTSKEDVVEEKMADAPANEEDLFDDNKDEKGGASTDLF